MNGLKPRSHIMKSLQSLKEKRSLPLLFQWDLLHLLENTFDRKRIYAINPSSYPNSKPKTNPNPDPNPSPKAQ